VGPSGRVVGVDYASGMRAGARQQVAVSGAAGIELVQGDMLALPYGEAFDAVVCVLGVFFVDDMAAAAGALWSYLRPRGTLAVTTFGTEVWTPMLEYFIEAAGHARPDIERILPCRRTEDPAVLAQVLRDGGLEDVRVTHERYEIPFRPSDWRVIVMGSGLRRIAVDLGEAAPGVLAACERWARARNLSRVVVSANYATAVKRVRRRNDQCRALGNPTRAGALRRLSWALTQGSSNRGS
jgi:SAM-dependent methyltransferase